MLALFKEQETGRAPGHPLPLPGGAHGAIGQAAVLELVIEAAAEQSGAELGRQTVPPPAMLHLR
jgi:hypothetical protein